MFSTRSSDWNFQTKEESLTGQGLPELSEFGTRDIISPNGAPFKLTFVHEEYTSYVLLKAAMEFQWK